MTRFLACLLTALTLVYPAGFQVRAGDILRGGAVAPVRTGAEPAGGAAAAAAAREQAAANAADSLARTAQALQNMERMQSAARAAAAAQAGQARPDPMRPGTLLPVVPNGLGVGALQPVAGAVAGSPAWAGAELPVQHQDLSGIVRVNVRQNAAQALLNWETFNVGVQTHLHFEQQQGGVDQSNWVVVNRVQDPSSSPSQILGALSAPGQVYILNRNGILFDGTSQVNVHSLAASSLPLNESLLQRGILNNPDSQFLFSATALPAGNNGMEGFVPESPNTALGRFGDVWVAAGAILNSPLGQDQSGGRILLAAPNVINEGSILAPNGQVILAAGQQVGVVAHRNDDPSLRGLDAFVGSVALPGAPGELVGSVRNSGLVSAERGNISFVGRELVHEGLLYSTTSVALNGRIDLLASFDAFANPESSVSSGLNHRSFLPRSSGTVSVASGAFIAILPEIDNVDTVAASELALRSQINVQANAISFGTDSFLFAPNALVSLDAGRWMFRSVPVPDASFVNALGSITVGRGAILSVAGLPGVAAPNERNFLRVELRGAELADAPLQREGNLRGREIVVDTRISGNHNGFNWVGTPLADVTGFLGLVERTVAELSTAAGSLELNAGGSIHIAENALLDVSGGWFNFAGGPVATNRLLYGNRVVDIANAFPEVRYDGIYNGISRIAFQRWGVVETFAHALAPLGPRFEPAYFQGADAGQLSLTAATMQLQGTFSGAAFNGDRQRATQAAAGRLNIHFETRDLSIAPLFPVITPVATHVVLGVPGTSGLGATADLYLPSSLLSPLNFGSLAVRNRGGDISVPATTHVEGVLGGNLSLQAANINFAGAVTLPGGSIALRAENIDAATLNNLDISPARVNPAPVVGRGQLNIAEGATLSTAGMIVDERISGVLATAPAYRLTGGAITLTGFHTTIAEGSLLDVSGGARVNARNRLTFGDAGSLSLSGGRDATLDSVLGGSLLLAGELRGFSGNQGAALSLTAPSVVIANSSAKLLPQQLLLTPDFFSNSGFSRFSVAGIGLAGAAPDTMVPGVRVVESTVLTPVVSSLRLNAANSGTGLELTTFVAEEGARPAAHLTFSSPGARDPFGNVILVRGETVVESTSHISTDAGGSIALTGNSVTVQGTLVAPGGSIRVVGGSDYATNNPSPISAQVTTVIGPEAVLDVSGKGVLVSDPRGLLVGTIWEGGSIFVGGNAVLQRGALLNASGTAGELDVVATAVQTGREQPGSLAGKVFATAEIQSSGGTIHLSGSDLLAAHAELQAAAGGANASGGTVIVESGRFYADNQTSTTADITLTVSDQSDLFEEGAALVQTGSLLSTASGQSITGGGRIANETLSQSGADHLQLLGNVQVEGSVRLTTAGSIRLASGGVLRADDSLEIQTGYLFVGQNFRAPEDPNQLLPFFTQTIPGLGQREFFFMPAPGIGHVQLSANFMDVGTLSLAGAANTVLTSASNIRGSGVFNARGEVSLVASSVYPTSANTFAVHVYDNTYAGITRTGSLRIESTQSGSATTPLSAGGRLSLHAAEIVQEGSLLAPFGTIRLGWDGSGSVPLDRVANAAVPVATSLTLGDNSLTSVSAVDGAHSGAALIPFGVVQNDIAWIDPRGLDVTLEGLTAKSVLLNAATVSTAPASLINTSGGGDLFGFRWIPGVGGTRDLLDSTTSFAILPGYSQPYAPNETFNTSASGGVLAGIGAFANNRLSVGDQVQLDASSGLPAGTYTLLPARYALLPGAFLLTPRDAAPTRAVILPEGSELVAGSRSNALTGIPLQSGLRSQFELVSADVLAGRAEYVRYGASGFLAAAAQQRGFTPQRLPVDAGQTVFSATIGLDLLGALAASMPVGARGGLVDINSPRAIAITSEPVAQGVLQLRPDVLNSFDAASLLVGGVRSFANGTVRIDTNAPEIVVANADTPVVASDLILAARNQLHLTTTARLESSAATSTGADPVVLGSASVAGSGDGVLVRVSSASEALVERLGIGTGNASLLVDGGARVRAESLVLDSSSATSLSPQANVVAGAVTLSSSEIAVAAPGTDVSGSSAGLVVSDMVLESIQAATSSLTLQAYQALQFFGSYVLGGDSFDRIELRTPVVRGFGSGEDVFQLVADTIVLSAPVQAGTSPSLPGQLDAGSPVLQLKSNVLQLNAGTVSLQQFTGVTAEASSVVTISGEGSLRSDADLMLATPLLAASDRSAYSIISDGTLVVTQPSSGVATQARESALAASLSLQGTEVHFESDAFLPSGEIRILSTAGALELAGVLDVSAQARTFFDATMFSDAGSIFLRSGRADVHLMNGSVLNVAGLGEGDAGSVAVVAPEGTLLLEGTLRGTGDEGLGARFTLDVAQFNQGDLGSLDTALNETGFDRSRDLRVRQGDVLISADLRTSDYRITADSGTIVFASTVDASGVTGGSITAHAGGSILLGSGARLDASAINFDSAGRGGRIVLEAGAPVSGTVDSEARVDLRSGAEIDLRVAEASTSSRRDAFTGTLLLRAPVAADGSPQVAPIGAVVEGASLIAVQGHQVLDLSGSNGELTPVVRQQALNLAANLNFSADSFAIAQPGLLDRIFVLPSIEIINRSGDLRLGSISSTAALDWNLADARFGPSGVPGTLTLRSSGNLQFFNALSDGFQGGDSLWLAPLMVSNAALPAHLQSWSFRLVAGADFNSARFDTVQQASSANTGSLLLGKDAGAAVASGGNNAQTASVINNRFQVIRTGTGDITVHAAGDVRLLNPFASIYTAGTRVADPTTLFNADDFVLPQLRNPGQQLPQGVLGAVQQNYPVLYSFAGGNVSISAGLNIERFTRNTLGELIPDSSRQLPNNWLYRRSFVDADGNFGAIAIQQQLARFNDPAASTTWWVDFSNFFQSFGTLGGGHLQLAAGRDVRNVDAVVPTNARMPLGRPDAARLVELGGGDLRVTAGRNIDGGVFYVERGTALLQADGAVTTNATRSHNTGIITNLNRPEVLPASTWLPTTLLLGKGSINVVARGDILLGPVVNTFMLPQSVNNRFWYKTYFNTFAPDSALRVRSFGGGIEFRNAVTLPDVANVRPTLQVWLAQQNLLPTGTLGAAFSQPWLRLAESSVEPFGTVVSVLPPKVQLASFSGDLGLGGSFNLFPSALGSLELLSQGDIQGLTRSGTTTRIIAGQNLNAWSGTRINFSDANPASLPSFTTPFAYYGFIGAVSATANNQTQPGFLQSYNRVFAESGAVNNVLQVKQALHAPFVLHANNQRPALLYAAGGSLSGMTVFTPTETRVLAATDITDVDFYIQNVRADHISVVAAGRDIVAFNPNSDSRLAARASGNTLSFGQSLPVGDLQISGPGTLQVLAGRNLDLGIGPSNADGTASGLTSVGNIRNPFLPSQGADIIAAAGIGPAQSLFNSNWDLEAFETQFLNPATAPAAQLLLDTEEWLAYSALSNEQRAQHALQWFFAALRTAGRNFNDPESPAFATYDSGFAAITALFPDNSHWQGSVSLTSRQVKTAAGGDISIVAPGGGLLVGFPIAAARPDQGILTESGGNVSIFTHDSVAVGASRIFTLRGGDILIWSSTGDIAAGTAARTVRAAPPTRVIIDPQTAAVQTDLSGLATGGGIGVLQTVRDAPPGDVDLIAPAGIIDAGDAGIRVSGNLNIAAVQVVNAANIQAGGSVGGVPITSVPTPNIGGLTAAASSTAAATGGLDDTARRQALAAASQDSIPSIVTVEVIGFGGVDPLQDEEQDEQ